MRGVLAVLAVATSTFMLGWIGLRDARRLAAQEGEAAARTALGPKQRGLLALGAVLPGLLLMLSGWWSSTMMWMGATVILLWLWVVRLGFRIVRR